MFGLDPVHGVGRASWVHMATAPTCLVVVADLAAWCLSCGSHTRRGASGLGSHGYCANLLGGSHRLSASVFGLLCNAPITKAYCQNKLTPIAIPYPQSPCGDSSLPAGRSLSASPKPTPAQRGPQRSRGTSRRPTACGRERGRPPARTGPPSERRWQGRDPATLAAASVCPATRANSTPTACWTSTCACAPTRSSPTCSPAPARSRSPRLPPSGCGPGKSAV